MNKNVLWDMESLLVLKKDRDGDVYIKKSNAFFDKEQGEDIGIISQSSEGYEDEDGYYYEPEYEEVDEEYVYNYGTLYDGTPIRDWTFYEVYTLDEGIANSEQIYYSEHKDLAIKFAKSFLKDASGDAQAGVYEKTFGKDGVEIFFETNEG